jgi:hypothetical protein
VLTGNNFSYGQFDNHTNITAPDSIVNRLTKALVALGPPWNQWVKNSQPDWGNIIIAGHSNGADHAGFLAKNFPVARALLFAGSNDMVGPKSIAKQGQYTHPAPWQYAAGATPPERIYGFGICGTQEHVASSICFNWHAGWDAQQLPGPWFRADSVSGILV